MVRRPVSKERAWCQADGGAAESPPPGLLPAINNPAARRQATLCTQLTLYPCPVRAMGGLLPGCPPPSRLTVPVPPRGSSATHCRGHPAGWERWASPGKGHLPTLLPSPRGTTLGVWACQVERASPALPAHVVCTKSTAERHRFLVNMFLISGDTRGAASLASASQAPSAAVGAGP